MDKSVSHVVFTVYDSKVGAFMTPFFSPSRGAAVRAFSDEVKRDGSDLARHPEDYTLFMIGNYDDQSGALEPCAPEHVAHASDFVVQV